uniref:Apple domain-containing protein n=1 Tax=Alexandrium monilatum TaxID=311494 RepID=A0A7S4SET5_9DINO|mmetsp:Transcript_1791/g.5973  ORF Transcript_1791/g.5973 Transcript_1791/m.5973 type:complete len:170 (+) Transcript_1791:115-624(+)
MAWALALLLLLAPAVAELPASNPPPPAEGLPGDQALPLAEDDACQADGECSLSLRQLRGLHGEPPAVKPDVNASREAEVQAAAAGVYRYPSTNCYDGRGGHQISKLTVNGNAQFCTQVCQSTAGCACFVTDDTFCYLNSRCDLNQCDYVGNCFHQGCGRLSAFTTWLLV